MAEYINDKITPLPALRCGQNARVDELNTRIYSRALAPHIAATFTPVYGLESSYTKYATLPGQAPRPVLPALNRGSVRANPSVLKFYTDVVVEDQIRHTSLAARDNRRAFVPASDSDLYRVSVPTTIGAGPNHFRYLDDRPSFPPNARVPNSLRTDSRNMPFGVHTRTLLRGIDV
jgi:hypothetical protein